MMEAQQPAGPLDIDALAKFANELLRALPGSIPVAAESVPSGAQLAVPPGASGPSTPTAVPLVGAPPGTGLVPTSIRAPVDVAARTPALLPHAQAPNGVPDTVLGAAPALDGRAGGAVLSVPQAASLPPAHPALPNAANLASPGPASYYFLEHLGPGAATTARTPPGAAPATPPGIGALLGPEDFAALFARPASREDPGTGAAPLPHDASVVAPPTTGSSYYFVGAPESRGSSAVRGQAPADRYPPFNVHALRADFPVLRERVHGRQLVWLDNAATTQKPQAVIDRLAYFYEHENSNIHRAAHELAARATDAYERARETVRRFLGAGTKEEIVFVRGATEAINLVAKSWGARHVAAGDEIVISHLEHHANIVPWQQLASEKGAKLRVIPVDDSGRVLLEEYQRLLNERTRIVAVTQVSNALGTVVPVQKIVDLAHRAGACALVDGAQSVPHLRVDLQALDADFFVFSGHKIFGPTGIGVLYGKRRLLEDMPPWQGGGNMISDVTFERTVYQGPPARFEAGTGNIADAVGLATALEYVERIGLENIARYEHGLLEYATSQMRAVPGLRLIGTADEKASVLSFVLPPYAPEEVGTALNEEGIAVRAGHHCAQPILRRFGLEATVRPSLAFYNTCDEVDQLVTALRRLAAARPAPRA